MFSCHCFFPTHCLFAGISQPISCFFFLTHPRFKQKNCTHHLASNRSRIVPEDFKGEGEKVLHLMAQTGAWFLGKHRMKVAISNLNNQIDIIQD
ncbi:hypothetical protein MtrunA17_Chr3g0138781 [Medicago truncatula]|uniref:Uncharacterized protein n=1 Tax=Medicago truncatula TaxID=3880 RepID=A0A396J1J4_MEDTR|nr:hypothetical protein MtrunA17_Chr3g0138781 [Medicago truncatula]